MRLGPHKKTGRWLGFQIYLKTLNLTRYGATTEEV